MLNKIILQIKYEKKYKPNSTTEQQEFGVSVPVIDKNKQKSFFFWLLFKTVC